MKFDARAVRLMPPGTDAVIDGFPGLRIAASATRRTWIYRYKSPVDGRMRQTKLGEWPAMSHGAAVAAWEATRSLRTSGTDVAMSKREKRRGEAVAKPEGYSVKQLCEDYLTGHVEKRRKPKGAKHARWQFEKLIPSIAGIQAASLTRSQAFDALAALSHTPAQAQMVRADLSAAWNYALDSGRLPDTAPNWWSQVMRGRLKSIGKRQGGELRKEKRVLSRDEVREVLLWLPNAAETLREVLTLYLWTGTRGAEIVAMEGREITEEPDGLWWTIPKAKTKNARHDNATDLRVPLFGRAADIVQRRVKEHGKSRLFHGTRREQLEQKAIQQSLYRWMPYSKGRSYQPRLKVANWSPHDLRRTARTMLAGLGCPREVGESILGHMLPGVEGTYNRHSYDSERRVWLGRLDAELERIARGE